MSEDFIKQARSVAFVALALSAVVYVYQYGRSVDQTFPNRTFSVDGEANIDTALDIATFTASVVTEGGKDVAEIQKQNGEKMNNINAYLKEQGVEKKDLQTSQYSLNPRYSYSNCVGGGVCPPPAITGYTLNQSLTVKVRNLDTIGTLLSGIVEKGANSVSGVTFTADDDTDSKQDARKEAIAKAQKKAQEIARAGNFRVGKLISLYEDSGVMPMDAGYGGLGMGGAVAEMKSAVPSVIEPGTRSGKLRVTLTFEIRN